MQDREEAERRCESVMAYLSCTDALCRWFVFRVALSSFCMLKHALLTKGAQWGCVQMAQQARDAAARERRYAVSVAACADDVSQALQQLSQHFSGRGIGVLARLPAAAAPATQSLQFRLWARAGAVLYLKAHREQQVYPWRLFALLLGGVSAESGLEFGGGTFVESG